MPTYTYTCTACNDVIEKRQSFSDAPLTTCEQCGGALRKVIHPVGIVFKGSGWYITDSRSSTSATNGPAAGSASESSKGESSKAEGSKAEGSKSDSKTTTATESSSSSSTTTAAK